MRVISLTESQVVRQLNESITALDRSAPALSARRVFTDRQRKVLLVAAIPVLIGLFLQAVDTTIGVFSVITAFYVAITANRVFLFVRSQREDTVQRVSDEDARLVPDEALPVYTVLVPAYHEPEVIAALLEHLDRLEYPRDKLDVKLLLEADDSLTLEAVVHADPADYVEVVLVPPAEPRTKPKALNYGAAARSGPDRDDLRRRRPS